MTIVPLSPIIRIVSWKIPLATAHYYFTCIGISKAMDIGTGMMIDLLLTLTCQTITCTVKVL